VHAGSFAAFNSLTSTGEFGRRRFEARVPGAPPGGKNPSFMSFPTSLRPSLTVTRTADFRQPGQSSTKSTSTGAFHRTDSLICCPRRSFPKSQAHSGPAGVSLTTGVDGHVEATTGVAARSYGCSPTCANGTSCRTTTFVNVESLVFLKLNRYWMFLPAVTLGA
jgi:hypothetical protein